MCLVELESSTGQDTEGFSIRFSERVLMASSAFLIVQLSKL